MPGIPQQILDEIASGQRHMLGQELGEVDKWRSASGLDVKPLIAALRENPNVTHINLHHLNIGSDGLIALAHALRDNKRLKKLDISINGMTDDSAAAFAAVLKEHPALQEFNVAGNEMLTDTGISQLAHALSRCPDLRAINFNTNKMGTGSASAIGQLMKRCHRIERIHLSNCGISAKRESSKYIADAIPHCPNLEHLMADDTMGVPKLSVFDTCDETLTPQTNPNLHMAHPRTPHINEVMNQNSRNARTAFQPIADTDGGLESFRTRDIAAMYSRRFILRHLSGQMHNIVDYEKTRAIYEYLENPPQLDLATLTRDSLVTPGDHGLAPLDNPAVWQSFPEIATALEANGTPLDLDFLQQKNSRGESWLECGMASAAATVLPVLNARGIYLQTDSLIEPDESAKLPAKPTPLLEAIITCDAVPHLFTRDNWYGADTASLRKAYAALPQAEQGKVQNLQGLLFHVGSQAKTSHGLGR